MFGTPKFDQNAFQFKRAKAVSKKTGIAFSDFGAMHIERRKVQQERRLPAPAWAMSDVSLREVVLRYCEDRLYIRNHSGTDAERMARISAEATRRLPRMQEVLHKMLLRYGKEASEGQPSEKLDRLQTEIQNRDSEVMLFKRGLAAAVVSAVYKYYRNGWDSVQIAEELGLTSPMVRQWLRRLNITAGVQGDSTWATPENLQRLFQLRISGHTFPQCSKVLGISVANVQEHWHRVFGELKVRPPKKVREHGKLTRLCKARIWTPERVEHLANLRFDGHTFKKCAKVLGLNAPSTARAAYERHCRKA